MVRLRYTVLVEPTREPYPPGWFYAHVPTRDLTTHGEGIEGAMEAARELVDGWITELQARGEPVPREERDYISRIEVA